MAPRKPKRLPKPPTRVPSQKVAAPVVDEPSEEEFHTDDSDVSDVEAKDAVVEQEYHTEESDAEIESEGEDEDEVVAHATEAPPYLPSHLLKAEPTAAESGALAEAVPFEQMTRKQKQGMRRSNRQSKKKWYDQLRNDATANGVLAAGKAAQLKRKSSTNDRVKTGRITKSNSTAKSIVSGRQQLVEERKRAHGGDGSKKKAKKAKTKSAG